MKHVAYRLVKLLIPIIIHLGYPIMPQIFATMKAVGSLFTFRSSERSRDLSISARKVWHRMWVFALSNTTKHVNSDSDMRTDTPRRLVAFHQHQLAGSLLDNGLSIVLSLYFFLIFFL